MPIKKSKSIGKGSLKEGFNREWNKELIDLAPSGAFFIRKAPKNCLLNTKG